MKKRCRLEPNLSLDLLEGSLNPSLMESIFEMSQELSASLKLEGLSCDCFDYFYCKHVVATIYGAAHRFENEPELFFHLIGVDFQELIEPDMLLQNLHIPKPQASWEPTVVSALFGIDFDGDDERIVLPWSSKAYLLSQENPSETEPKPLSSHEDKESPSIPRDKRQRGKLDLASSSKASKASEPSAKKRRATSVAHSGKKRRKRPSAAQIEAKAKRLRPSGKSIQRLRKQMKLSAQEFAERLGVSVGSVYRWEAYQGRLTLQNRTLRALATLLLQK